MNKLNKQCYFFKCTTLMFIFQHILPVRSNICPFCQKASECPIARTLLAAVLATDKRLIALWYLMRISAHLAFSSSAQKDGSHWGQVQTVGRVWRVLLPTKNEQQHAAHYGMTSAATLPYLMFIDDVTVTSL